MEASAEQGKKAKPGGDRRKKRGGAIEVPDNSPTG
jgi:hypothetical protein